MTENKDTFLEHRKNQEKSHFDNIDISDPLSSLLTVEINTTDKALMIRNLTEY